MKYRIIILLSFFAGSLISLASLIIIREQQPHPLHTHPGNDMVGLAYGLAVGFNIVLALCSLPSLLAPARVTNKAWLPALLLLGLPLAFTLYSAIGLDAYALLYCLPYLLVSSVLFIFRVRKERRL
ncbi:hypothetical protein U0035_05175 [Niabella yanshanensis]|uniref:Lipoprotein n=1 Tax=Niabella yanshanensis TaxID=577386 RepID=A0ABZ0WAL1_9BACT|nr:hypothetical protein [Niabella yanshanensis]WQD39537.1 hypothetical protein U0035_05175 [Niabella yanshanensis]